MVNVTTTTAAGEYKKEDTNATSAAAQDFYPTSLPPQLRLTLYVHMDWDLATVKTIIL